MKKIATDILERKIRLSIVGCGRVADNHLKSIQQYSNDLELVSLCDSHEPSLQKAMQQNRVPGYHDLKSLLAESNADVVVLCTPSGLHASQTTQIAQEGKHIITEKPMATRWKDGLAMLHACDENNVRLFVVKQIRHNPIIQLLKQAIDRGRFGRIYLINLNVFWTRPQDYYDQAKWRGTWEFDGGVFMNQASHYVDLLTWLFGPVQSVQAMMATLARKIETEDTGILNLLWRSGALGSMNVTMLTYPNNMETSITVLGENGSVKIGSSSMNQVNHWEFAEKQAEDDLITAINEKLRTDKDSGHSLYYQHMIAVMRGKTEPETDGREGLRSLELLIAAYVSARDGKTISLPLEY